jgi:hypothetical protein
VRALLFYREPEFQEKERRISDDEQLDGTHALAIEFRGIEGTWMTLLRMFRKAIRNWVETEAA